MGSRTTETAAAPTTEEAVAADPAVQRAGDPLSPHGILALQRVDRQRRRRPPLRRRAASTARTSRTRPAATGADAWTETQINVDPEASSSASGSTTTRSTATAAAKTNAGLTDAFDSEAWQQHGPPPRCTRSCKRGEEARRRPAARALQLRRAVQGRRARRHVRHRLHRGRAAGRGTRQAAERRLDRTALEHARLQGGRTRAPPRSSTTPGARWPDGTVGHVLRQGERVQLRAARRRVAARSTSIVRVVYNDVAGRRRGRRRPRSARG